MVKVTTGGGKTLGAVAAHLSYISRHGRLEIETEYQAQSAYADADEEARFLFSSLQQSSLNNRIGRPGRVPPPVEDFEARLDP